MRNEQSEFIDKNINSNAITGKEVLAVKQPNVKAVQRKKPKKPKKKGKAKTKENVREKDIKKFPSRSPSSKTTDSKYAQLHSKKLVQKSNPIYIIGIEKSPQQPLYMNPENIDKPSEMEGPIKSSQPATNDTTSSAEQPSKTKTTSGYIQFGKKVTTNKASTQSPQSQHYICIQKENAKLCVDPSKITNDKKFHSPDAYMVISTMNGGTQTKTAGGKPVYVASGSHEEIAEEKKRKTVEKNEEKYCTIKIFRSPRIYISVIIAICLLIAIYVCVVLIDTYTSTHKEDKELVSTTFNQNHSNITNPPN